MATLPIKHIRTKKVSFWDSATSHRVSTVLFIKKGGLGLTRAAKKLFIPSLALSRAGIVGFILRFRLENTP